MISCRGHHAEIIRSSTAQSLPLPHIVRYSSKVLRIERALIEGVIRIGMHIEIQTQKPSDHDSTVEDQGRLEARMVRKGEGHAAEGHLNAVYSAKEIVDETLGAGVNDTEHDFNKEAVVQHNTGAYGVHTMHAFRSGEKLGDSPRKGPRNGPEERAAKKGRKHDRLALQDKICSKYANDAGVKKITEGEVEPEIGRLKTTGPNSLQYGLRGAVLQSDNDDTGDTLHAHLDKKLFLRGENLVPGESARRQNINMNNESPADRSDGAGTPTRRLSDFNAGVLRDKRMRCVEMEVPGPTSRFNKFGVLKTCSTVTSRPIRVPKPEEVPEHHVERKMTEKNFSNIFNLEEAPPTRRVRHLASKLE